MKKKTTTKVGQYKPQQIDIESSDKSEDDFPKKNPHFLRYQLSTQFLETLKCTE